MSDYSVLVPFHLPRIRHNVSSRIKEKAAKEKHPKRTPNSPPRHTVTVMSVCSFPIIYAIIGVTVDIVTTIKEYTPATDTTSVFYLP